MTLPIEREKEPVVQERAEEASPLLIERKEVVTPTPSKFSGQVYDDSGQPIIETPENKEVTVDIPKSQADLQGLSKGSSDDAATWWGWFWLRMIKKALLFGWKIIQPAK